MAAASEIPSTMMKASRFEKESELAPARGEVAESFKYFNADFLRWMLSDGAGAVLLENSPRPDGLSLEIERITYTSYANELPTCMYLGCSDPANPRVGNTWLSWSTLADAERDGLMFVRQDTKLLGDHMTRIVARDLRVLADQGLIPVEEVDLFLPHLRSYFFEDRLFDSYAAEGVPIAREKWFTNLSRKGNTGAASIYILLEEVLNEGIVKSGDTVLAMVPESGRFSVSYALFRCVGPQ